jgi:hypothetical protein
MLEVMQLTESLLRPMKRLKERRVLRCQCVQIGDVEKGHRRPQISFHNRPDQDQPSCSCYKNENLMILY